MEKALKLKYAAVVITAIIGLSILPFIQSQVTRSQDEVNLIYIDFGSETLLAEAVYLGAETNVYQQQSTVSPKPTALPGIPQYSEMVVQIAGPSADTKFLWDLFTDNYVNGFYNLLPSAQIYYVGGCDDSNSCSVPLKIGLSDVRINDIRSFITTENGLYGIELFTLGFSGISFSEDTFFTLPNTQSSEKGKSLPFAGFEISVEMYGVTSNVLIETLQFGVSGIPQDSTTGGYQVPSSSTRYQIETLVLELENNIDDSTFFWRIFEEIREDPTRRISVVIQFYDATGNNLADLEVKFTDAFISRIVSASTTGSSGFSTTQIVSIAVNGLEFHGKLY